MARIVAFESVTLDGVMQAPGRPDEGTRGGAMLLGRVAPTTTGVLIAKYAVAQPAREA